MRVLCDPAMRRVPYRLMLLLDCCILVSCSSLSPAITPSATNTVMTEPMDTATVPTLVPTRTPRPSPTPVSGVATILVDPQIEHQTMDGIGANSYTFPYANDLGWDWEAVKFVFDELDIAYIRLAPWLGWWETANDNDDPYTIDWDGFGTIHDIINAHDVPYAQYLHERGIELGVGIWNFSGVSEWCETCEDWLAMGKPRQIDPALYPEVGESIASYILHLQNHGVPLRFAEVQNEPDIEASIQYPDPEALRESGRTVLEMFDHYGLTEVLLHAPNLHSPNDNLRWIEAWFEDEILRERTVAVSYHTWWSQDQKTYEAIWQAAQQYGKPVWATEVGYQAAGRPISPNTWDTSWQYAKAHYQAIAWSHAARTYIWSLLGYDAAVGENGERYPMFYVLKHFSNSIPAGSVLLESRSDDRWILPLAFRRPDRSYALIVLNDRRSERTFVVTGLDMPVSEWTVTSERAYDVAGDPAQASGPDGITVTLPPLSLVSMVLEPD